MAAQPDTPAALIEAALLKAHKLKPPHLVADKLARKRAKALGTESA